MCSGHWNVTGTSLKNANSSQTTVWEIEFFSINWTLSMLLEFLPRLFLTPLVTATLRYNTEQGNGGGSMGMTNCYASSPKSRRHARHCHGSGALHAF